MANLALKFVGLRDSSQCQPALFTPITLFALIGLIFSSLAVAHASSPSADSVLFTTSNGELIGSPLFSPDGTLIAIQGNKQISDGTWDGVVWLWDVASRKQIATLEELNPETLSFSPDGTLLAAIGGDGFTQLWDVASRKQVATLQHEDWDATFSFSPDGTLLATGGGGLTRLWDVASRKQIATLQLGDNAWVLRRSFSPDGTLLAIGGGIQTRDETWDAVVWLWDVASRKQIATFQLGDRYWVQALSFSPDGTLLATGGFKQEEGTDIAVVWLWDVASRKQIATLDRELKPGPLSFSPDGTLLAIGGGAVVWLWDVASRKQVAIQQPIWVQALSFSPDGTLLATGGGIISEGGTWDEVVWLWDVASRKQVATFPFGDEYQVAPDGLSFSPDGTLLAIGQNKWISDGNWEGVMRLWDVSKWKPPHPSGLVKISGDNQQSTPGTALARPLVIEVRDQHGNPLPNARVTFSVTAGGGTLSSTTATTDAKGRARSTLTLGSDLGTNTVSATIAGLAAATFTATAVEQIPHSLTKVSGDGQQGPVSTQLAKPFVVLVLDEEDAAMAGAVVTFTVTGGGGTMSSNTAITSTYGRAARTLTLGDEPGTNTVKVSVAGLDPVTFTATAVGEEVSFDLSDLFSSSGKLAVLPDRTQLLQNAPNPFNSQTVVSYFLLEPGPVRLEVFALSGQRVAVLQQGPQQAGYHRLHWDGRDIAGRSVASGTYLYRLVTDETVLTRKLVLLR